jgi:hypothetical protein
MRTRKTIPQQYLRKARSARYHDRHLKTLFSASF